MPSPAGHAIAAAAAGWLVLGAPRTAHHSTWWREALLFGALGALPDIDLLFGAHRWQTHSLGVVAAVGGMACLIAHRAGSSRPARLALACALAYGSHLLLDWLGHDMSPPIGIMALWPFSDEHYESGVHVFSSISRRYWLGWPFVRHNLIAVGRELLILVPLLAAVVFVRRRRHHNRARV